MDRTWYIIWWKDDGINCGKQRVIENYGRIEFGDGYIGGGLKYGGIAQEDKYVRS